MLLQGVGGQQVDSAEFHWGADGIAILIEGKLACIPVERCGLIQAIGHVGGGRHRLCSVQADGDAVGHRGGVVGDQRRVQAGLWGGVELDLGLGRWGVYDLGLRRAVDYRCRCRRILKDRQSGIETIVQIDLNPVAGVGAQDERLDVFFCDFCVHGAGACVRTDGVFHDIEQPQRIGDLCSIVRTERGRVAIVTNLRGLIAIVVEDSPRIDGLRGGRGDDVIYDFVGVCRRRVVDPQVLHGVVGERL